MVKGIIQVMSELVLHSRVEHQLEAITAQPKGSYLFHGPVGSGKATTAVWLARALNCSCQLQGECANCKLLGSGNFPDLVNIEPEKSSIGIAQIQQLQQNLSLRRFNDQGRRVVVIDQAESLTREAQNCLLKTLEEPPSGTTIILVVSQVDALLDTVRSRCTQVYFAPVSDERITEHLVSKGVKPVLAQQLAQIAEGQVGTALRLAQDPQAQRQWLEWDKTAEHIISSSVFDRLTFAQKAQLDDIGIFQASLSRRLRRKLRANPGSDEGHSLLALERFKRRLGANVAPKAAMEALMLELKC